MKLAQFCSPLNNKSRICFHPRNLHWEVIKNITSTSTIGQDSKLSHRIKSLPAISIGIIKALIRAKWSQTLTLKLRLEASEKTSTLNLYKRMLLLNVNYCKSKIAQVRNKSSHNNLFLEIIRNSWHQVRQMNNINNNSCLVRDLKLK